MTDHLYSSPVHSLILDPTDPCWKTYFTSQELHQIQSYQAVSIPSFPKDLQTYLGAFSKMVCSIISHASLDDETYFNLAHG